MATRNLSMTLAAAWLAQVGRTPQRIALVFDDERWSYADLHRAARQAARQLEECGLIQGERVIVMMDNGPAFVAAFLGCQLLGVVPVPVSPRSSLQRVRYLLDDSEASIVLVEPALPERLRALHRAQAYGARIVTLEPRYDDRELPCPTHTADDCAFIEYTSGSGGDSKGVMISHRAVLTNIRSFSAALGLTGRDIFSSLLPLYHDMGLVCFGLAPLLSGRMLVLHRADSLSLYPWLSSIAKYRATITGAPDSLLQIANRVVDEPLRYDLRTLRLLICGSEPVRRETIEIFGSRFGVPHAIKPAYGMAELTLCATITPAHEPARVDERGHVASGWPIDGVDIRIATDDGTCTDCPGVCGEIRVRSPAAMSGYWMRQRETVEAFDEQGYMRTGDLGYLDAQGCLYVVGRRKNMLVRSGEKYSPHDLEAAAQEISAICRAAVVQSQRDDARIIAVLEVDRPLLQNTTELHRLARLYRSAAHARAGLAPDGCWFVPGGSLPCTENGKMRHAALRAQIDRGEFLATWSDTSPAESHADAVA